MSGTYAISGLGAGGGIEQIMQLRSQIIQRNDLLKTLHQSQPVQGSGSSSGVTEAASVTAAGQPAPTGFAGALKDALDGVNSTQTKAEGLSAAYERGEMTDVAKVMLARQEAGVAFEATLQVRNKLLSAYQDIMRMGV